MYPRILTKDERRKIKAFNKQDGEKEEHERQIYSRCRRYLPAIKEDLVLIEEFMKHYESHIKKD